MDEFENKLINGIHVSRYIISWVKSGGKLYINRRYNYRFIEWLRSLNINGRHLTEEELDYIYRFASNGKLELENQAREFLKEGA